MQPEIRLVEPLGLRDKAQRTITWILLILVGIFIVAVWMFSLKMEYQNSGYQEAKTELMTPAEASETQEQIDAQLEESLWIYTASNVEASTYGWGERLNVHTFCGDVFDPDALTVALPAILSDRNLCGRTVKICRGETCIEAVANDGGPAGWTNRKIDMSQGAARAIGIDHPTIFKVDMYY